MPQPNLSTSKLCILEKSMTMTKVIRARTMDRARPIRLKDFDANSDATLNTINTQVVSIDFQDNEATRRMVMHSAKRVIRQHREEIEALAYK